MAERNEYGFCERLDDLLVQLRQRLDEERQQGRRLTYCKAFFSDLQNQHQDFLDSALYQEILQHVDLTLVEQPPVDGTKITLLVKTSDEEKDYIFQSLRLTDEEAKGQSSYLQTMLLFEHYIKGIEARGLNLRDHCVRTWIYVADIRYFLIYLRDISDYAVVDAYMQQHYPAIPRILVSAKVCRPQWLIEMEAVAEQNG
ncbi:MAG: hypothetical protein PUD15_09495 [Prevotella sp.]|nr:hypothetical protein [Prevotella sp.]